MTQKTLDDMEPVLDSEINAPDKLPSVTKRNARSRRALEVYDEIQAAALIEEDPLF